MATVMPGTSHIIPSRNRPAFLAEALGSILSAGWVPAELILVDQSDTPHPRLTTGVHPTGCHVRYLWKPDRGLSRGRNVGVRAATHDTISFSDDDVLVRNDWFVHLVEGLWAAGPRSAATGQVVAHHDADGSGFAPSITTQQEGVVHVGRTGRDVLPGNLFALGRAAFAEVGLFDVRLGAGSRFPGAEDNDFGYRLLEQGYAIHFIPEVVIYHRAWRVDADLVPLRWRYGRGQGAFMAKHIDLDDRYMLTRFAVALHRHARRIPWQLRLDRLQAMGSVAYVAGLVSGAGEWLLTQRRLR